MNFRVWINRLVFVSLVCFASAGLAGTPPSTVVREYINGFKERDKPKVLMHLDEEFCADYKVQYLAKVESYPEDKRETVLKMFELDSLDQLRKMTGREIISSFMDKPAAKSYWAGFDAADLVIEISEERITGDQAFVTSLMWVKEKSAGHVETTYTLARRGENWRIVRFSKKLIRP